MKNLILIPFLLLGFFSASSQDIEVLKKTDSIPSIKEKGLIFINTETDLTDYYFIAKIQIRSNDYNQILRGLQKTAIKFSANAFKYIEKEDLQDKTSVTLELFSANEELVRISQANSESNVIYFFGNDSKTQKFKIDKKKIELNPNEIYRYEILKGQDVKINKGGFTGMTVFHRWKENQSVIFYAFGSGDLSPAGDGSFSIGFVVSTGSIMELKSDFAYLLMALKK
ncbi:MAG: hypothetical protein ACJARX_001650 [Psychroserpens sp.]|jgi:hypothetical protein|uniref:hypothetical protein n=1 Tax=Psychroserpens sp. TaxID=2020870 RepID=UPI0039E21D2C